MDEHNVFRIIYVIGNIFQALLVWAVTFVVIKTNIKHVVKQSYLYSYQHYGLMCGATVVALVQVLAAMYGYMVIAITAKPDSLEYTIAYTFYMCLLGVCILPGIPIAIFFTCKTKPPAIPYIIMIPVALLFCCCNTERAKSLVFGIALWIIMMAVQIISFTTTALAVVVWAEPFVVATNTLILILVAFCLTNIFALLFTISAYLFTPRYCRSQGQRNIIIRAAILIPLLLAIICYCISFAVATEMANARSTERDVISVTGSAMIPVIIGAVTFGLKKLIVTVLKSPMDSTDHTSTEQGVGLSSNVVGVNDLSEDEQPLET